MRILALSNPPWCGSGYGVQAAAFIRMMKHLGHDVAIVANHGLRGGIQEWEGTKVYPQLPSDRSSYFSESLGKWAAFTNPDIVMTFMDAWVTQPQYFPHWPWVFHGPIDVDPSPAGVIEPLKKAFLPLVYSKWGTDVARRQGVNARYMPLTVDTNVFNPGDKTAARQALGWPTDKFIVGMVAANVGQVSRKCFPQNIEGFARFHKKHPDSILYLHTDINGHQDGVPLKPLIEHLGIGKAISVAHPFGYEAGFAAEHMANVYRGLDVLLAATATEGFGLPILEAQACGTPAITGDWSSMSEITFPGSYAIPKSEAEPFWWVLGGYWYIPRIDAIANALSSFFDLPTVDAERRLMVEHAERFSEAAVAEQYWRPILAELRDRISAMKRLGQPSSVDRVAAAFLKR